MYDKIFLGILVVQVLVFAVYFAKGYIFSKTDIEEIKNLCKATLHLIVAFIMAFTYSIN